MILRSFCSLHPHQTLQFHSQGRTSLHDELIESFGIACLHPAAPAHHSDYSVEDNAGHHRAVKHLQHGSAEVKRSESLEKIQVALTFPVQSLCVFSPVQFVVCVKAQVQCPALFRRVCSLKRTTRSISLCGIELQVIQLTLLHETVHHTPVRSLLSHKGRGV